MDRSSSFVSWQSTPVVTARCAKGKAERRLLQANMSLTASTSISLARCTQVGYCQGMAYIAAVLLMHMDEEDAFWAFYCLMESPKHFKDFYSQNLARVQQV